MQSCNGQAVAVAAVVLPPAVRAGPEPQVDPAAVAEGVAAQASVPADREEPVALAWSG